MKEVKLFISGCVYGPSWRSHPFQILLTQKVELNLVQIIQDFFFLMLILNRFPKVLLGLTRAKQEKLHPQLSLNWNQPKIDTALTSQVIDEVLHVLTSREHCGAQTCCEIWIESGLSCGSYRVEVLLYCDALFKGKGKWHDFMKRGIHLISELYV